MKILVSGGSSGLGKFLVNSLRSKGHDVCSISRSPQSGHSFQCDVSSWESVSACRDELSKSWPSLDALICCAGIQGPIGPAMETDPTEWRKCLSVNLDGTYHTIRAFYPLLMSTDTRSKIICFSGGGATSPRPNFSAYGAAKTAVVRLVETLGIELIDKNIDINAVAPGAFYTSMTAQIMNAGKHLAGSRDFDHAVNLPEDNLEGLSNLLGLIELLLSNESDGLSGKLISAQWDNWRDLCSNKDSLMNSDIYCLRRILPADRVS